MASGIENLIKGSYEGDKLMAQLQGDILPTLKALAPQVFSILQESQRPYEMDQLGLSRDLTRGYNDLAVDELGRTAPRLAQVQSATDAAQASGDLANLNKFGVPMADTMRAVDNASNPEYAANLQLMGSKMTDALGALSPTLSPGTRAEIERGNARMGGAENDAATTAMKAMNFGHAGRDQANSFANAITQISSALPQLRSGLNPIGLALGRDSRSSNIVNAASAATSPSNMPAQMLQNMQDQVIGMNNNRQNIKGKNYKSFGDAVEQDSRTLANLGSAASGFASAGA